MVEITLGTAMAAVGAAIAMFAGFGSATAQGRVAAASVGAVAEKPEMLARGIIFTAMPETQAIYGFLIGLLLLVGVMGGG